MLLMCPRLAGTISVLFFLLETLMGCTVLGEITNIMLPVECSDILTASSELPGMISSFFVLLVVGVGRRKHMMVAVSLASFSGVPRSASVSEDSCVMSYIPSSFLPLSRGNLSACA